MLTVAAALAIASTCVSPSLAPIIVGISLHESGRNGLLEPYAIHDNQSGRSYYPDTAQQAVVIARSLIAIGHGSLDVGIAQVTTANFGWLGLTIETALDPCRSFAASSAVLFAKYNGNPPGSVKALYAAGVTAKIRSIDAGPPLLVQQSVDVTTPRDGPSNNPFAQPARTGRDLVFNLARTPAP